MQTTSFTRRRFVKSSGFAASALLAAALPSSDHAAETSGARKLKVLCVGGHPDDPESGCAGTLSRYTAAGHAVTIVYLTRGERGIRGKSLEEAAAIRSAECQTACKIIGATPLFFGQIDGDTEMNHGQVNKMTELFRKENAGVIFTQWPIDTHMDHQVASFLTIRAWMALRERPGLYFYEVDTGAQTEGFSPDTYVDVSEVLEKKKSALVAHASQNGEAIWRDYHEVIALWRGREAGVKAAEAFVHLSREAKTNTLPGL